MAAASKVVSKPRKAPANDAASPAIAVAEVQDVSTHVLAGVIAAAAVGAAVQNGNGMLHGDAVNWLLLAVVAAGTGILAPHSRSVQRVAAACLPWATMAGLVYAFYMWPFTNPAHYVQQPSPEMSMLYRVSLAMAAVLSGLSLAGPQWLKRQHLAMMLLAVYAALGVWVMHCSPAPYTDVVFFHKDAIAALLQGDNPFAITFKNIYNPDVSMYPADAVRDGRLLFGYMYPPINLLLAIPGYLFGDYRYALLAANLVSGYLMTQFKPLSAHQEEGGDISLAFVALFLFTPRALFVLENGWIEPFTILFLTLTITLSVRAPKFVPYTFGLLIASKQYVIFLMAAAWQLPTLRDMGLDKKAWFNFASRVVGTVAVATLPFFLWSPTAFWHSVVEVPANHPFRADALSFPAWLRKTDGTLLPTYVGFLAAALTSFAIYKRMPRTLAGFAYSFGAIFLFFIAFNRQAFCNYYFLVIAAFCAAAALGRQDASNPQRVTTQRVR